jgi:hypothetical protein
MKAPSRIAIAIAAVITLSACSEAQKSVPAAESPAASKPPTAQADQESPPTVSTPAVQAEPNSPPTAISVEIGGICSIGVIDNLKGAALSGPVQVESDTTVSGWRTYQAADGTEAEAWLRVLGQDGGVVFQIPLPATGDRPDVAKAVNRSSALRSGFSHVKVTGLQQGSYTLEVVLNAGPHWVRCRNTRQLQVM